MMDYKIKLEYKGIGKQASDARQKAIQARKIAEKKGTSPEAAININKQLLTSIQKLILSNKSLETALKAGVGAGKGGAGAGAGLGAAGAGAGIGSIGASIPFIGAAIATAGFTIQKANQIGNAYINLANQQLRSVGTAGFRKGTGIYGASEMGAGMGAFARGTGKFANNVGVGEPGIKNALAVGTRFGMSAEQVLGQAGTFARAGGDIGNTAGYAAAKGVQSDMPILLSGMAGMLEEAIRSGIDATDMAKDLGRGLTEIAMETPTKSVEAAMSIVRSFQGVKTGVAGGKMAGFENILTAQAGRDVLMQKISDPNYRKQLLENKDISVAQKAALEKIDKGASYQDLQKTIGISGAQDLLQKTVSETSSPELLRRVFKNIQGQYGTGAEGRQKFTMVAQSMGFSQDRNKIKALWDFASQDVPKSEFVKKMQEMGIEDTKMGAQKVEAGPAGIGAKKMIQMQNLVLKHGEGLAEASFKMQTALVNLADTGVNGAVEAINKLSSVFSKNADSVDVSMKKILKSMLDNPVINPLGALYDVLK